MTISGNIESFQCFQFKIDFLENENLFQETGEISLVESIKIENVSFPHKTDISEVNVKTNKMLSTKLTYHKERSFASNCFVFQKTLFQFKNLF